ncbi:MAG: DegT/DnrJ/EryC1/StrS family aminotransferase [Acidobacteria bacterium]|nr:DegT/DnrJ/EryC1/StrS family aminotransferase [Acidobacteriota bacterium]
MQIKMVDLHRQYLSIKAEIDEAIQSVLTGTDFIMGAAVREFEADLATYLGAKHAVGCASGTDALQVAMMSLGIGGSDEVITSPFTFVATAETIALLGAIPVYVDIDAKTYNLDVQQIAARITSKTKAIIPVHLYGQPADLAPLLTLAGERGLKVIEDAAQAIGARYRGRSVGTVGDIGCFSFFPSKNLGAYGDGGAMVTNDAALAERCQMVTVHGSKKRYQHELLGVNSRLDTLQAAVLKVKLRRLEAWTEARIGIANRYNEALEGLELVTPYCAPDVRHVYNQYSIRTSRRDALAEFLKSKGVGYAIHYPLALHQQLAFRHYVPEGTNFPVAEAVSREILSLPIYPEMPPAEVEFVIACLREFFQVRR